MTTYIVRRVLWLIPVLLVVSIITFALMQLTPGSPFQGEGDRPLPPGVVRVLENRFGLNRPTFPFMYIRGGLTFTGELESIVDNQYVKWITAMATGDFGPSFRYRGRTATDIVLDGLPASAQLGTMAFLLAVLLGIPLGLIAALRQNKWPDYTATFISVLGIATPSFILAILLIVVFAGQLRWFPTFGWRGPETWVLPTIALGGYGVAQVARYTRASLLEVTRRDYVRTAYSKGLKERSVVVIHMLRNALIPVVTILGPLFAGLVTGSFVVETIFGIPGIGRFYVDSIDQRDYMVIMAMSMLYAAAIALMNLVVDITYGWIDPRIRYS